MKELKIKLFSILATVSVLFNGCSSKNNQDIDKEGLINSNDIIILEIYNPKYDKTNFYFLQLEFKSSAENFGYNKELIETTYRNDGYLGQIDFFVYETIYYSIFQDWDSIKLNFKDLIVNCDNYYNVRRIITFNNYLEDIEYNINTVKVLEKETNFLETETTTNYTYLDFTNQRVTENEEEYLTIHSFNEYFTSGYYSESDLKTMLSEIYKHKNLKLENKYEK